MTAPKATVIIPIRPNPLGGELYVGIMTVINSVREVVTMPVTGITHGCQPVIGYNYGAQLMEKKTALLERFRATETDCPICWKA